MRIAGNPGRIKHIAQKDIGGLSANPGQREKLFHCIGHPAVKSIHYYLTALLDIQRLVPIKTGRPNIRLYRLQVRLP